MDKAKGRAKEAAGSLTGDQDRKAEGRREGPRELIARRLPSTLGPGRSSLGPLSARSRTPEAAGEREREGSWSF